MKLALLAVVVVPLSVFSGLALCQQKQNKKIDIASNDTRTYAQKEQARAEAQAKAGYEAQQREMQAEQMRDKRHDGLRMKVGPNTSVGVQTDPAGVNVRTTVK